jgi:hypothetical protein
VTELAKEAAGPLVTALDQEHGFETDVGHLTVFGTCRNCRAAAGQAAGSRDLGPRDPAPRDPGPGSA